MQEKTIKKLCSSPAASQRLAQNFAKNLSAGSVVLLQASLGGGKTFFTRFVLQALGVTSHEFLGSPTFTLVQAYQIVSPSFEGVFYHIDLYRLSGTIEDLDTTGLLEIQTEKAIIFIEWPDLYMDSLIKHFSSYHLIQITVDPMTQKRLFTFSLQPQH